MAASIPLYRCEMAMMRWCVDEHMCPRQSFGNLDSQRQPAWDIWIYAVWDSTCVARSFLALVSGLWPGGWWPGR